MNKAVENLEYLSNIIWKYDKKIFIYFFLSMTFCAISPYFVVLAPKYILGTIINRGGREEWILLCLIFGIGSLVIYILESIFTSIFKSHLSASRNGCFGDMLTEKMLRMRYEFLEQPNIQDLCFRANMLFWSDFSGMAGIFENMKKMLSGIITIVGFAFILIGLHPLLPFVLILSVLVNVALMANTRKKEDSLRTSDKKVDREKQYLDTVMQDVIFGKDIRIYGMSEWLAKWYLRVTREKRTITDTIQREYVKVNIFASILGAIRDGIVYGILIYAMLKKVIFPEDFIMYVSAITGFTSTLILIVEYFQKIQQFLTYTNDFRLAMQLEETEHKENPAENVDFHLIKIEHVNFAYPNMKENVLSNVNLQIKEGEHIAIVGANGSGKTTLVKLLVGLYEPTNGCIEICDKDGNQISKENRLGMFAIVMQKIFQYAFTIKENITFEKDGTENKERIEKAFQASGLEEEIVNLPKGIDTPLRKEFHFEGIHLSGGQAQKMALARAVYKEAPILVLDEPTASMDALAELDFYRKFETIFHNKTCVFISHRLSSVMFCDRIVLLDKGGVAGVGTHEELLLKNELYVKMWKAQSKPYKDKQKG